MTALQAHGPRKYPNSGLLLSSSARGWGPISAELRAHPKGVIRAIVPQQVEINIAIKGREDGLVTRMGNGMCQRTRPTTGTVWLVPIGVENDVIDVAEPLPEILHLYLPSRLFDTLADDFNLSKSYSRSVQYLADVQDDLIRQIGVSILSELTCETAAGRMLVETSSLTLAARLAQRYSDGWKAAPLDRHHRLDNLRLRRVLDYIDEHINEDISVQDLAGVACLSPFHFTRMFSSAMGMPPARFISQQRLEKAKTMLANGKLALSDIALNSCFSSQASFSRAFRRATGVTPGEYQRQTR